MSKFPNSFLQDHVLQQFKVRSDVMGRVPMEGRDVNATNDAFLQSKIFNSAWIVAISSVDDEDPKRPHSLPGPELAKNYILSGGVLVWDGTKLVKRSGLNTDINSFDVNERKFAYNNTMNAGIRSMPGITDFTINSTNRWGTIRKATLKFNTWSLDDLELMDRLYFRPGYHIIVEWGHTWGLDNKGNPVNSLEKVLKNYDLFFSKRDPLDVTKAIKANKKQLDLNYDGFLGLITNFSWAFRSDLGYDCSIEIVSRGSVLESLTTKSGRPATGESVILSEQAPDDIHKLNFLTKAMKMLNDLPPTEPDTKTGLPGGELNIWYEQIKNKYLNDPDYKDAVLSFMELASFRDSKTEAEVLEDDGSTRKVLFNNVSYWAKNKQVVISQDDEDRPPTVTYIPLLVLFHLFNKFLELSSSSSKIPRFDIERAGEYYTFNNHITLEPLVAALPYPPDLYDELSYIFHTNPLRVIEDDYSCFNLMVTEKCVSEKLFEQLNSEGAASEVDLYTLCQSILGAMNTALGGINELDLDYDEINNKFVLLDRSKSSDYSFRNRNKIVNNPLIVAGLKSIATDLNVVTKISKSLGSMIAIASQGDDSKSNVHLGEFKKWNQGLIDRFDVPPAGSTSSEENSGNTSQNTSNPGGPNTNTSTPGGSGNEQPPVPATGGRKHEKSAYPKLPVTSGTTQWATIPEIKRLLAATGADVCTQKAIFTMMVQECKYSSANGGQLKSAGDYNFAGVQTDVGKWGCGSTYFTGTYIKIDSGNARREFAAFPNTKAFIDFMACNIKKRQANPKNPYKFNGCDRDSFVSSYIQNWWSPEAKAQYTKGSQKYKDKEAIYNTAQKYWNQH